MIRKNPKRGDSFEKGTKKAPLSRQGRKIYLRCLKIIQPLEPPQLQEPQSQLQEPLQPLLPYDYDESS